MPRPKNLIRLDVNVTERFTLPIHVMFELRKRADTC
jgi:hypothetical protein